MHRGLVWQSFGTPRGSKEDGEPQPPGIEPGTRVLRIERHGHVQEALANGAIRQSQQQEAVHLRCLSVFASQHVFDHHRCNSYTLKCCSLRLKQRQVSTQRVCTRLQFTLCDRAFFHCNVCGFGPLMLPLVGASGGRTHARRYRRTRKAYQGARSTGSGMAPVCLM